MTRFHDSRWRVAVVLITAVTLAAILIGASHFGAGDERTSGPTPHAPSIESVGTPERSLLAGIEQHGTALGSPRAPVTRVEYADLQCPYCAEWSREALPTLIEDYVRPGKLRIVFRGLAFIGADSDEALRAAIAAGQDDHLWDIVHGLYENQGAENAGWVTDELVTAIAAGVPGLDAKRLLETRWEQGIEDEMERAPVAAQAAGVSGTPAFQLGATGGRLRLLEVTSLGPEGIVPAIEDRLAG
jgi:protein-disulfide isomerase